MYNDSKDKIIVTIEARMGSSRLPGKVLLPLAGKPALARMIDRIKSAKFIDEIVVATTINSDDDQIVKLAKDSGVKFFRGSEKDVLNRVLGAARSVGGDIIVELTGDCPLMDGRLIDRSIDEYFQSGSDYASNIIKRTYPDGFDVQVFSVNTLSKVDSLTKDPIDRVHVSYFIYNHPEIFKLHNWEPKDAELVWPDLRLTLDEKEDYELIDLIFKNFSVAQSDFSALEIVNFLKQNPKFTMINKYVRTKQASEG